MKGSTRMYTEDGEGTPPVVARATDWMGRAGARGAELGTGTSAQRCPLRQGLTSSGSGWFSKLRLEDCLNISTRNSKRKLTLAGSFRECKITRKDIRRHSGIQQMDQAILLKTVNHSSNFS